MGKEHEYIGDDPTVSELDSPPACPCCNGTGTFLGKLGCATLWFRCRQCGIDFVQEVRNTDE